VATNEWKPLTLNDLPQGTDRQESTNSILPTVTLPSAIYTPYQSPGAPTSTNNGTGSSVLDPTYCTGLWNTRTQAIAPKQAEITTKQNQINNLMASIRGRTSGSLVTESQVQRMYESEKAVLESELRNLNYELQNLKAQYPVC
jgi:hypothetical protein